METAEHETGAQLFSRLGAKERLGDLNMPLFSGAAELLPGDVVEFCGSEGTGKSELLMNIAAVCILPKSWHGVMLPGRNVEIVFVSTDYKLDLVRLVSIMEGISRSHGVPSVPEMKFNQLISSSLKHLHVLNCNSMEELVITLYLLNTFLKNHPDVCMLVIDNITTFWWTEKAANLVSDGEQQRWTCALSKLVREHHLVVIAARPLITQEVTSGEEKTMPDEALNRHWSKLVKLRFLLQKATVKQTHAMPTIHIYSQNTPRTTYRLLIQSTGVVFLSS